VNENTVDLDSVLALLPFIALTNCLGSEGKVIFSMGFKCHLRIDRGQSSRSVFFMCSKNTMLPLGAKKNSLWSRDFCVFTN